MVNWITIGTKINTKTKLLSTIGLCFLALFSISFTLIQNYYDYSFEKEFSRSPQSCEEKCETNDYLQLKWFPSWGDGYTHGYILQPNTTKAPLPPGMNKWVDKGQALVSPQLSKKYPVGSKSPLGEIVGTIPLENLSNPDEEFFYTRPTNTLNDNWGYKVESFQGSNLINNGDLINLFDITAVKLLFFFFIGFAGIVALLISTYSSKTLKNHIQNLRKLSISNKNLIYIAIGITIKPIIYATTFFIACIIYLKNFQITLPIVKTTIIPQHLETNLLAIILMFIGFIFLYILNTILSIFFTPKNIIPNKINIIIQRIMQISVIPSLILVWIFITQTQIKGLLLQILLFTTILSLTFSIPIIVMWILEPISILLSKHSKTGSSIFAYKKIKYNFWNFAKINYALAAILIFIGTLQQYTSQTSDTMAEATRISNLINNTALYINTEENSKSELEKISKELSKYGSQIFNGNINDKGVTKIQISEQDKQKLNIFSDNNSLVSKNSTVNLILNTLSHERVEDKTLIEKSEINQITLISDSPLPIEKIQEIATNYGSKISKAEESWIFGAKFIERRVNWFILLSIPTIILLMLCAIEINKSQIFQTLSLNQLEKTIGAKKYTLLKISTLTTFIPLTLTSILSLAGYKAISTGFTNRNGGLELNTLNFQIALLLTGITISIYTTWLVYKSHKTQ